MKKLLLFIVLLSISFVVQAQERRFKFGFISYDAAIKAMPEYVIAQKNLSDLKSKYDAETKRSEDEFNRKYEEFLDGQRDFAPSILQKRQAELQDMIQKNVAFKNESRRLLQQAEIDAYTPLRTKLSSLLQTIGKERGYAFILNTDNNDVPFVDLSLGEDVIGFVKETFK